MALARKILSLRVLSAALHRCSCSTHGFPLALGASCFPSAVLWKGKWCGAPGEELQIGGVRGRLAGREEGDAVIV